MKRHFLICLTLLSFYLQGCFYQPVGENYMEVDSTGVEPSVIIDLNFELYNDTIYMCIDEPATFRYRHNDDEVVSTTILINGIQIGLNSSYDNGEISYSFYVNDFSPGIYSMSMTVFTHSGTGSIADKLGAEGYSISKEWILVITENYTEAPRIIQTSFVDGKLKIAWEQKKGFGFKKCELYKDLSYVANSRVLVATITDKRQFEYIDTTYHGEQSDYFLIIDDNYWSNWVRVEGPLPELSAITDEAGRFILKWDVPPYYKNLKGYKVSYFNIMTGEFNPVIEINDAETDSCIIPDPITGYEYNLLLTMDPKSDVYYDDFGLHTFLSTKLTAYYGTPSPVFYWTDYGSAPMIYMQYAGNILAYNTQSGQVEATVFSNNTLFRFGVSENNHYLVSMTLDPIALHFIDLNNPENNKPLTNMSLGINSASVSNIGTGLVVADNAAYLYDYLNEKPLGQIELTSGSLVINKISPSGNYFVLQTNSGYEFFEFNDNKIQRLPGLQPQGEEILYADYLPGTPEQMVIATTNFIELIDCYSWSVVNKLTTNNPINTVFNLDYLSRNLFFCTSDNFVLMNIETGNTDIISKAVSDQRLYWSDLIYINNQIFWSGGKKSTVKQ